MILLLLVILSAAVGLIALGGIALAEFVQTTDHRANPFRAYAIHISPIGPIRPIRPIKIPMTSRESTAFSLRTSALVSQARRNDPAYAARQEQRRLDREARAQAQYQKRRAQIASDIARAHRNAISPLRPIRPISDQIQNPK